MVLKFEKFCLYVYLILKSKLFIGIDLLGFEGGVLNGDLGLLFFLLVFVI